MPCLLSHEEPRLIPGHLNKPSNGCFGSAHGGGYLRNGPASESLLAQHCIFLGFPGPLGIRLVDTIAKKGLEPLDGEFSHANVCPRGQIVIRDQGRQFVSAD